MSKYVSLIMKTDGSTDPALAAVQMSRISGDNSANHTDVLAVEEPLEIRLGCDVAGKRVRRAVSITMRTPGHDLELAVGFLFTEGIIFAREQVAGLSACSASNVARVNLRRGIEVDLSRLERYYYAASSCGVCGKASLEAVRVCPRSRPQEGWSVVEAAVIHRLPATLRRCAAMYYPEANVLVPIESTEPLSNGPTFKHTVISLQPAHVESQGT